MSNKSKQEALEFLMSQKGGVVSTVNQDKPQSAFVFYDADEDFSIYFATTLNSKKHINIQSNNNVSFVVSSVNPPKTIQIEGKAMEVSDKAVLENALANYIDIATYGMKNSPPIAKMNIDDGLILYKLKPNFVKWSDYSDFKEGDNSVVLVGDSE